ncbi:MAG: hypothetical protein ACLUE8_04690 [Lachnospiraceae bacterium]
MKLVRAGCGSDRRTGKRLEGMQATLKEIRVSAADEVADQPMEGQISMSELEGSGRA